MKKENLKIFVYLRYIFTVIILALYYLNAWLVEVDYYGLDPLHWILGISAILLLINFSWIDRVLILINLLAFSLKLIALFVNCKNMFLTYFECFQFLSNTGYLYWEIVFRIVQISLVIYLIAVEIKVYKSERV